MEEFNTGRTRCIRGEGQESVNVHQRLNS
jgi:hypothetical protein